MIRAVLDADVLYPLPLRDTLLSAAWAGCFQPVWSDEILEEAIRNLLKDRRMTPASAQSMRMALEQHFEDAFVAPSRAIIAKMQNHPKDRHVAACAVAGEASLIVTGNLKDFLDLPPGVQAVDPDAFLLQLLAAEPDTLAAALHSQSSRLQNPPITVDRIVELLSVIAPKFARAWAG